MVVLTYLGRSMTTFYSMGIGHRTYRGKPVPSFKSVYDKERIESYIKINKPTAGAVLESLMSDDTDESFEDWCLNYGYETDSRRALDTYLKCQEQGKKTRRLLGADYSEIREEIFK